ncbi:MAG: hypothetical protein ACW99Q_26520, partial [Candidatus Kariarchaeaceae archaeon]
MIESKRSIGMMMSVITSIIIIFSFLPDVPFSNYYTNNGEYNIDYPFFGNGRGTFAGSFDSSVTSDELENSTSLMSALIIYISWIFQLIRWLVFSFYQKEE